VRQHVVQVRLDDRELHALDAAAAARFATRSAAVREGLALLNGPVATMSARDVLVALSRHARGGSLPALTALARAHGLLRAARPQAVGVPYDAALAEVDAIYDRNRERAEDAEWLMDGESREMLDELAARRELGPGAT
jgi:hypothetical protein